MGFTKNYLLNQLLSQSSLIGWSLSINTILEHSRILNKLKWNSSANHSKLGYSATKVASTTDTINLYQN